MIRSQAVHVCSLHRESDDRALWDRLPPSHPRVNNHFHNHKWVGSVNYGRCIIWPSRTRHPYESSSLPLPDSFALSNTNNADFRFANDTKCLCGIACTRVRHLRADQTSESVGIPFQSIIRRSKHIARYHQARKTTAVTSQTTNRWTTTTRSKSKTFTAPSGTREHF